MTLPLDSAPIHVNDFPKFDYTMTTLERGVYVERPAAWVNQKLSVLRPMRIYLCDSKYHIPTMDYFLGFIHANMVNERGYVAEWWDCDKYARHIFSIAPEEWDINSIGLVIDWSSGHAYNSVIFPEGNVMLLEPQTDSLIFVTKRNKKLYGLRSGFILV